MCIFRLNYKSNHPSFCENTGSFCVDHFTIYSGMRHQLPRKGCFNFLNCCHFSWEVFQTNFTRIKNVLDIRFQYVSFKLWIAWTPYVVLSWPALRAFQQLFLLTTHCSASVSDFSASLTVARRRVIHARQLCASTILARPPEVDDDVNDDCRACNGTCCCTISTGASSFVHSYRCVLGRIVNFLIMKL